LDFGLAKLQTKSGTDTDATLSQEALQLSMPGATMGTLTYMSPEQARGKELDVRTDIFSFGAVLYEMMTGKQAFSGNSAADIFDSILNRAPTPAAQLNPETPPGFEHIINKALEKDRNLRYQSAGDVRTDLERLKRDAKSAQPNAAISQVESMPAAKSRWFRFAVVTGAAILVMALAVGGWLSFTRKAHALALTDKDTIVLADFDNKTGDAVFDDTLKQALAVDLGQSPFLNILSEDQVRQTLREMTRSPGERLTQDVAREVCQRAGSKAYLSGSIASLGSKYVIGLNAVNCQTGDSLSAEQERATSKEQVLAAMDKAAAKLRNEVGESLSSVQKFDVPLDQATTNSLEALNAFTWVEKPCSKRETPNPYRSSSAPSNSTPTLHGRMRFWESITPI
jgi:eukaryotic-like serine/threonine-protein kinase